MSVNTNFGLTWPIDVVPRMLSPTRPFPVFTFRGRVYQRTTSYGLIQNNDKYNIVPLYKSGTAYYYDTGKKDFIANLTSGNAQSIFGSIANVGRSLLSGTGIREGTIISAYPRKYEILQASELAGYQRFIGNANSSKYLAAYYAALPRGSSLFRNDAEMAIAMQRIKDCFMRENPTGSRATKERWDFLQNNLRSLLIRSGFPRTKIEAFLANRPLSSVLRPGRGTGDSGGSTPGGETEQRIVVRAPFGYIRPPERIEETRPTIIQVYPVENNVLPIDTPSPVDSSQTYATEKFTFPYIPNNIQYQGSGSEWVEIPRGSDFPIVEWSRWQLMKISMEFLIAGDRVEDVATGTKVPDGLFYSVSDKIETLRRMAQRPYPVSVFNMDQFFTIAMRRAQLTGRPLEFVITDFSWTATRRTTMSNNSEISVATCRMTLQETPIESTSIIKFNIPILAPKKTPKKKGSPPEEPDDGSDGLDQVGVGDDMKTNPPSLMPTSTSGRSAIASMGLNGGATNAT